MKRLIILALLCLSFVATHAAPLFIINNTNCPMQVTPVCYDPSNACTSTVCGAPIVIPPLSSVPLPAPCGCATPMLQGYVVCYLQICPGICTTISDASGGPCLNFPPQATLPQCQQCSSGPLAIYWDSFGDLVIQ